MWPMFFKTFIWVNSYTGNSQKNVGGGGGRGWGGGGGGGGGGERSMGH